MSDLNECKIKYDELTKKYNDVKQSHDNKVLELNENKYKNSANMQKYEYEKNT